MCPRNLLSANILDEAQFHTGTEEQLRVELELGCLLQHLRVEFGAKTSRYHETDSHPFLQTSHVLERMEGKVGE